jgi:hypothetical protein
MGTAGVARCYLAPDRTDLPFRAEGDYVWIDLAQLPTHTVVVVEEAPAR